MTQILYQSGSSQGEALMEQRNLSAESMQHSRLLLSVHAAAHKEAVHAISLAAADYDITVRPRYGGLFYQLFIRDNILIYQRQHSHSAHQAMGLFSSSKYTLCCQAAYFDSHVQV